MDEEGYCIPPKLEVWENDKGSFYSSSDTDSGKNGNTIMLSIVLKRFYKSPIYKNY